MSYQILTIDKDLIVFERERAGWTQRGVHVKRVDNMCEAAEALDRGIFLFMSINADNIDYLPMLPILRKITNTPIFIITSHFTIKDQVEALHNGANVYAPFQGDVEDNIISALALLDTFNRQFGQSSDAKIAPYKKLLVFPTLWAVFCGDKKIPMSKIEFKILLYMIANRGITVSYEQIYEKVWGTGYDDTGHHVLWNHMMKLRKKIQNATGDDDYIENIRDVGYLLLP